MKKYTKYTGMKTGGATKVVGGDERFKDQTTIKLVPEEVSECSLVRKGTTKGTCLSDQAIAFLSKKAGIDLGAPDHEVVESLKKRYSVHSDKDLVDVLPDDLAKKEIKNFKIDGPSGVELLSNTDIDMILAQWQTAFPDFYPYNFNMRDYTQYSFRNGHVINEPDTLATVDPMELFKSTSPIKCCGCIINSDFYHGQGKHWMALFADNRGSEPTVEFFNSSGRAPDVEWVSWLNRAKRGIDENNRSLVASGKKKLARIVYGNMVQQYSMTECGVYSLFYIWGRLNRTPAEYFERNHIPDELMFEFRAHLYNGYSTKAADKWSYDTFKQNVHIKWDHASGHREGEH